MTKKKNIEKETELELQNVFNEDDFDNLLSNEVIIENVKEAE